MTFTLFSAVILLILGLVIFCRSRKGYAKGFTKSAIDLVIMIFSLLMASVLSSRVFGRSVAKDIIDRFELDELVSDVSEAVGGDFDKLFEALVAMVASSVVFLLTYFVLVTVCRIIIGILYKTVFKPDPNDVGYVGENEPWHRRNSKKLGALVGGISGFLAVVICMSPIVGSIKTADKVFAILEAVRVIDYEDHEAFTATDEYADDFGITVLYKCGGGAVYNLGARTRVNKNTVILSREIDTLQAASGDINSIRKSFQDVENIKSEDFVSIKNLCECISDSYLVRALAADFVAGAANSWRLNEEFLGIPFPFTNDTLDPIFDGVFGVFASTTEETVVADLLTFSEVSMIIIDSGLLDAGDNYDDMMEVLEDGSVMNRLTAALEENERMRFISDTLYRTAMKTLMKTIKFDGYDIDKYDTLISNITDQLNRLDGQSEARKIDTLTDYAVQYISDYGVDVPDSVAEMVVSAMIKEVAADSTGYISPEKIGEFFDKYYTPSN